MSRAIDDTQLEHKNIEPTQLHTLYKNDVNWNVEPIKQSSNDKLGRLAITADNHIPFDYSGHSTRVTYCNYLFNYINHISMCEIWAMSKRIN